MERKGRVHGYYYDGETQWVMYEDEDGYIEMTFEEIIES